VKSRPRLAVSIDVEDWFQTSAMAPFHPDGTWPSMEPGLPGSMATVLGILGRHRARCTFFFLGTVLDRHPEIVDAVMAGGHEIASHGYWHRCLTGQTAGELEEDLQRFAESCSRLGLPMPRGYRAPSLTMVEETVPWAVDALTDAGYSWDSSIYPMIRIRYGMPGAPAGPYMLQGGRSSILEIPIASCRTPIGRIPAGGGAWMRLYPGFLHRFLLRRIWASGLVPVLYMHPWEFGRALPGGGGYPAATRVRQGFNTGRTQQRRLERLLESFDSVTISEIADSSGRK